MPPLDVPVDSVSNPLTPDIPAFALPRIAAPLELDEPAPDVIAMRPPVPPAECPPATTMSPPSVRVLALSPPLMRIEPPSLPSAMVASPALI